jgi:uncharacterized alkaline shock family protein YloU
LTSLIKTTGAAERDRHDFRATPRGRIGSNPSVEAAHSLSAPLGKITIAPEVVAHIAGHAALESYGVVGMSARGRVGRLLARERAGQGVTVGRGDDGITIDLYVVCEYGLNLAEVASGLRSRVAYDVERLTGLSVASVEVHIQDVRTS